MAELQSAWLWAIGYEVIGCGTIGCDAAGCRQGLEPRSAAKNQGFQGFKKIRVVAFWVTALFLCLAGGAGWRIQRAEQKLEIEYSNKRIKKICTDAGAARKAYGSEMAKKIHQRIDEIRAAPSVESLVQFRIGRCHFLSGRRRLQ